MAQLTKLFDVRPIRQPVAEDLRTRLLESRLEDGYRRIEQALARGEDVGDWEVFWIDLLRQYEAAVLDLPDAA